MSGVNIIRKLLADYAPLTALVPAANIKAGALPQAQTLPAVSVYRISGNQFRTVANRGPSKQIRERVQVTVLAPTYELAERMLKAAALGRGVHTGQVFGYYVNSVVLEGIGPYIPSGDDKIHEQSLDFMVTFTEAN